MCETRFYVCQHCGNLVGAIKDSGVPMMCCGQKMTKLIPGTVEASKEKHIPVVTVEGNTVRVVVGEVEHPMAEEHSILWVYLQTDKGGMRKCLSVGSKPVAAFTLVNEKPLAVYAYCNLHGLWMTEIEEKMVCPLQPVDVNSATNYTVCKCNNVSFFDILEQVNNQGDIDGLLNIFENVKNTTHCSTGCGGCYDKVINIISEAISNGKK